MKTKLKIQEVSKALEKLVERDIMGVMKTVKGKIEMRKKKSLKILEISMNGQCICQPPIEKMVKM